MDQDEAGTAEANFASAKSEVCRLAYDLDGVRGWSNGSKADQKDAVERYINMKRWSKEDSNRSMEDLEVRGGERVILVVSSIYVSII